VIFCALKVDVKLKSLSRQSCILVWQNAQKIVRIDKRRIKVYLETLIVKEQLVPHCENLSMFLYLNIYSTMISPNFQVTFVDACIKDTGFPHQYTVENKFGFFYFILCCSANSIDLFRKNPSSMTLASADETKKTDSFTNYKRYKEWAFKGQKHQ
jgi:hypothetical protein